jgi:hypothetical protein
VRAKERRAGRARPRMYCFLCLSFVDFYFGANLLVRFFLCSFLCFSFWWLRPYYDRFCQSVVVENGYVKKPTTVHRCFGSGSAAAMALRAACRRIANKRQHTLSDSGRCVWVMAAADFSAFISTPILLNSSLAKTFLPSETFLL